VDWPSGSRPGETRGHLRALHSELYTTPPPGLQTAQPRVCARVPARAPAGVPARVPPQGATIYKANKVGESVISCTAQVSMHNYKLPRIECASHNSQTSGVANQPSAKCRCNWVEVFSNRNCEKSDLEKEIVCGFPTLSAPWLTPWHTPWAVRFVTPVEVYITNAFLTDCPVDIHEHWRLSPLVWLLHRVAGTIEDRLMCS
jgi:hypothetical protein